MTSKGNFHTKSIKHGCLLNQQSDEFVQPVDKQQTLGHIEHYF